jgi:hypothetical protein
MCALSENSPVPLAKHKKCGIIELIQPQCRIAALPENPQKFRGEIYAKIYRLSMHCLPEYLSGQ